MWSIVLYCIYGLFCCIGDLLYCICGLLYCIGDLLYCICGLLYCICGLLYCVCDLLFCVYCLVSVDYCVVSLIYCFVSVVYCAVFHSQIFLFLLKLFPEVLFYQRKQRIAFSDQWNETKSHSLVSSHFLSTLSCTDIKKITKDNYQMITEDLVWKTDERGKSKSFML